LEENVKLKGYVTHKKSLEIIAGSNVVLLLITVLGSKGKEILTGKIFEYLASKKPIIAIAPKDNLASKLIKSLGAGIIIPPRNIDLVKKAILLFYKKWKNEKLVGLTINSNELQKFNRIKLTQRLSEIFDKVKK
jgi:glycosyltransferase involved in cell wall biosynthesis